jgi:hypothetical protein
MDSVTPPWEDVTVEKFYGRIRSRLPDSDGQVCFAFEHTSGAILQLKIKPIKPLPLDEQRIVAIGELVAPGVIAADEIHEVSPGDTWDV